jgi:hypothetical protein
LQVTTAAVRRPDPLLGTGLFFAALYALSLAAVSWIGLRPAIPWQVVPVFLLVAIPLAATAVEAERLRGAHWRFIAPVAGVLMTALYNWWFLWPLAIVVMAAFKKIVVLPRSWKQFTVGLFVLTCGYAALWNVNYILVRHPTSALHDPQLRDMDLTFYSKMAAHALDYTGLFPLVRSQVVNQTLENAYLILMPETLLVLLLVADRRDPGGMGYFIRRLFFLYVIGVACFLVYPAIGPCLYYPDSTDAAATHTGTKFLIDGMLQDYRAALHGGTLRGFGYFIAVPSLHAMLAMLMQWKLRTNPVLFALFAPVNLLIVLSTVMLGYHYALDVVVAAVLVAAMLPFYRKW